MGDNGGLTDRVRQDLDLLRRHVSLLQTVEEHQPIGIIRLSELLGYPQHKVRYTLRVLEQEGLIKPSQEGARTTAKASGFRQRLKSLLGDMRQTVDTLTDSL
jgi:predicted transcriptional regulator